MINDWEYLVEILWLILLQHIGNIFFSVNIVINYLLGFFYKKNIVINYWEYFLLGEYLVPNIVINYVITTYWEYI